MLHKRIPLRQTRKHYRAASRPMSRRQERLFLGVILAVGILLQAAAVLHLVPLID